MKVRLNLLSRLVAFVAIAAMLVATGCNEGYSVSYADGIDLGDDAAGETVIWPDVPIEEDLEDDAGPVCLVNEDCLGVFPDLDPCQFAVCDTMTKQCVLGTLKDYTACDDGDACTEATYCLAGACGNGFTPEPPDDQACFEPVCDPATGWGLDAVDGPCDDGNPCTDNDMCTDGVCAGQPTPACDCATDADCLPLEDGNLCNGVLICLAGACTVDAGSVVVCDHSLDTLCSVNTCDPATGLCAPAAMPDGNPCDDGTTCTLDDTCQGGVCVGGENVCVCEGPADCEVFEDDNLCNGTLFCAGGVCAVDPATVIVCPDDGNPCTASICVPASGICQGTDLPDGLPCSDGDPCTAPDSCHGGTCTGGPDICVELCGDGFCDADETCLTCPLDCGECPVICGDNICAPEETCETCPGDCGDCPLDCGDGVCADDEDCHSCPLDCGLCPADCGDGACGEGEDCLNCPEDCGLCPLDCGDGLCNPDEESCASCPLDCGACTGDCCAVNDTPGCEDPDITDCVCAQDKFCCLVSWDELCVAEVEDLGCGDCGGESVCGDGACDADEDCESCPFDCGACPSVCGDLVCDGLEDCESCPVDCGDCAWVCGNDICEEDLGEGCWKCPDDCGQCDGDCCEAHATPGCGDFDVMTCVCALDPFCCETMWDDLCVEGVEAAGCGLCGPIPCGDGVCADDEGCNTCSKDCDECSGDCCAANGTPGCDDPIITDCVCDHDSFCCQVEWNEACVAAVEQFGCGDCGVEPFCGDGICTGVETCETCPEDCGACGEGDCCEANGTPGCDNPEIMACVCVQDPYCCVTAWDSLCVDEVEGFGCGKCSVCGDGDCSGGENGDNCCEDCGNCVVNGCPDVCACDSYCCTEWDDICQAECEGTSCGNGKCEPCEDDVTCPEDCGVVDPFCGDGVCNGDEDANTCCEDCGNCVAHGCPEVCECDPFCCTEWDSWCEAECNGTSCGDGVCQPCEDEASCPADCLVVDPFCGDGVCNGDEDGNNCCEDCGLCVAHGCPEVCECDDYCCTGWDSWCEAECNGTSCGDGVCQPCEDKASCPADCLVVDPFCGDGVCNGDEDGNNCCEDCGLCVAHGCPEVCECDDYCCTEWDDICQAECDGTSCGNGYCEPCETEDSCPEDCLVVDPFCGDGVCNGDETDATCCEDCGQCIAHGCPWVCECDDYCCTAWDSICEAECQNTSCGNGACDPCETEVSCPEDCLIVDPFCGDGVCNGDEDAVTCCEDCGLCIAHGCPDVCECDDYCCTGWDGICEIECQGTSCGNDYCEPCETEDSCPEDCLVVDPFCGDGVCNGDEDGSTCCEDCGQCIAHGCPDVCVCDPFCCTAWDNICEAECNGTSCGNDYCEPCEDEASCPEDCAGVVPFCGDGVCNGEETAENCCDDCGNCVANGCPDVCLCDPFCCTGWDSLCEIECSGNSCGNGNCEPCEDDVSCPEDCGGGPYCGDGICNGDETCTDCPQDCGECPPCDDPGDIPDCAGECYPDGWVGDGYCDQGQEPWFADFYCEEFDFDGGDCDVVPITCGDGECNGDETCETCPLDCGECPSDSCEGFCGTQAPAGCFCDGACFYEGDCCDDVCDFCGEDFPEDCGLPYCGDGDCGGDETCEACPDDCGECQTSCEGNCGVFQGAAPCQCDAACFWMGDCCDDVCNYCSQDFPDDCDGACDPGEVKGCDGECYPDWWVGDGICDAGLNCAEFDFDGGDCA